MENLVYLSGFNQIISKGIEFGSIAMAFTLAYRFLTTHRTRKKHHRIMRVMMFRIHRICWFRLTKNASLYILNILNKIYGEATAESRLFGARYFNQRSWKASFTFALVYVVLGVLIFPIFLLGAKYNSENMYYFASLVVLAVIFYILKERISKKSESCDKYRLSIISILYILAVSAIYSLADYSQGFVLMGVFVFVPLILVWKNGFNGLAAYFLSLFLYVAVITNIFIISYATMMLNGSPEQDAVSQTKTEETQANVIHGQQDGVVVGKREKEENENLSPKNSESDKQKSNTNYVAFFFNSFIFLIVLAFKYVFDRKKYSYKSFYKALLFMTVILCPVMLAYKNNINVAILYLITWVYFLYALLFFLGIVFSNSVSDLVSSNVSRWLFYKIQRYKYWREILIASIVDLIVGSSLVLLTSVLIGGMFSSLYIFLSDDSPLNIYKYMTLVSKVRSSNGPPNDVLEFIKEYNMSYIIAPILNSFQMVLQHANIHIKYSYEIGSKVYLDAFDKIGYVLWYMYITTLIPTILHILFIKLLLISKIANYFVQRPALYVHKLLLEEDLDDGYFGKAFSGTTRATIFIGFTFAAISMLTYIIIVNYH